MTIELLTIEEYALLRDIQKDHKGLTFQNDGYQYINKDNLSDAEKEAFKEVEELLKKKIHGFSEFFNFKLGDNNKIRLRFNYGYSSSFTGVGYILLDELLNGFNEN